MVRAASSLLKSNVTISWNLKPCEGLKRFYEIILPRRFIWFTAGAVSWKKDPLKYFHLHTVFPSCLTFWLVDESKVKCRASISFRAPVLILAALSTCSFFVSPPAYAELKSGMAADVVVGQPDFTSSTANNGGRSARTLSNPVSDSSDGSNLFITDWGNHRVLIYKSIPTTNNASADVVVGQANFTSGSSNQGGNQRASSLSLPYGVLTIDNKLLISDNNGTNTSDAWRLASAVSSPNFFKVFSMITP